MSSRRGRAENNIPMPLWTFRIFGHAVWANECPHHFPTYMNNIFNKQLRKFILVFLDDFLIYNKTWDDHEAFGYNFEDYVGAVSLCQNVKMRVWVDKDFLFRTHNEHKGSIGSLGKDSDNIGLAHTPKTLTELRGFLGNCSYYQRFVKGFSQLSAPVHL